MRRFYSRVLPIRPARTAITVCTTGLTGTTFASDVIIPSTIGVVFCFVSDQTITTFEQRSIHV
jgi:hypothetical protein